MAAYEEIMSAIFLIAVLFLVLPSFLNTNSKLKQFIQNISIWTIIVLIIVVIIYLINIMKKINLAITGCLGRMGQQLIKSSKKNKDFKIVSLTENRNISKKINGIKFEKTIDAFKKANVIIDFTVPRCTIQVLKIASKLKKKSSNWNYWFF